MNRITFQDRLLSGSAAVPLFRRAVFVATLVALTGAPSMLTASQWKTLRSDRQPIAIMYHEAQINRSLANRLRLKRGIGNRALREDEVARVIRARTSILNQVLQWSETAYQREVVEMGFSPPAGIWREYQGKRYLHVFLYDFGDEHGGITFGSVSRANSALKLNLRAFWVKAHQPGGTPNRALRGTVAHELFHAIQNQYAVNFSRWAKESTAEWCVEQVFPYQNHFVSRQSKFIRHPHHSMHQVFATPASENTSGHDHHRYAGNLGRPYGASAFWMFVADHHGRSNPDWMTNFWNNARRTNDAYEALSPIINDAAPHVELGRGLPGAR